MASSKRQRQLFGRIPEVTKPKQRSRRRKRKDEIDPYPLQGDPWCAPWLRPDGHIWIYAGYGQWEALPPDDPRVALRQRVWARMPDIWQRDLNMLTTFLTIRAAHQERNSHGSR